MYVKGAGSTTKMSYDIGPVGGRRKPLSSREIRRRNERYKVRQLPSVAEIEVTDERGTRKANTGPSFFGRLREAWRQALEALKDSFSS